VLGVYAHYRNRNQSLRTDEDFPVGSGTGTWFDYDTAFSRNLGWLSAADQARLRHSRVAIAGVGGVGAVHLMTLARLGISRFHLADMDHYELANFNRQISASQRTLGQHKAEASLMLAREINPEIEAKLFNEGICEENIDAFLDGVDVYVDGLDFFVLDIRRKLFARARERGIAALTAGPLGFGTGYIIFTPQGMSFEDFFRFEGKAQEQQYLHFLFGLTPWPMHMRYLADTGRVDLARKRGPSTIIACQLCAGVAGASVVKLLLGRGPLYAAPYYHQFDPYLDRYRRGFLRWGNAGPLQRLKLFLVGALLNKWGRQAPAADPDVDAKTDILTRILSHARWAPSPDNSQPWRFERRTDMSLRVHIDRESDNPYQYRQSETIWLSIGMLVEALALAASHYRYQLHIDAISADSVDMHFDFDEALAKDPLSDWLKARTVDRSAYQKTSLTQAQRSALESELGKNLQVQWMITPEERRTIGALNARATNVRLHSPACFAVHQNIIDWDARFSETGIPSQALGLPSWMLPMMRWALRKWTYMRLALKMGAARMSALMMDEKAARHCAAFMLIATKTPLEDDKARLHAGRQLMRLWLRATELGLAFQPCLAPIWLASQRNAATASPLEPLFHHHATDMAAEIVRVSGRAAEDMLFIVRLGKPVHWKLSARSIRLPLIYLWKERPPR